MTDHPTISVIIPVYNGERFLAEAIQSVLDQTLPPDEIIVVDDGSTDNTREVVTKLSETIALPVLYIYQKNQGPSAARNQGLRAAAKADWVAFLDADDVWDLRKQEIQVAHLSANPEALMVWGLVQMFEMQGMERIRLYEPWHGPNIGSALIRREVFDQVGIFDEGMRLSEDLDWYLRARDLEIPQVILKDIALWYRRHEENLWLGQNKAFSSSLLALKKRLNRRRSAQAQTKDQ